MGVTRVEGKLNLALSSRYKTKYVKRSILLAKTHEAYLSICLIYLFIYLFILFIHSFIHYLFFFSLILIPGRIAYLSLKLIRFLSGYFLACNPENMIMIIYVLIAIYKIVTVIMNHKFEGAIDVDNRSLISLKTTRYSRFRRPLMKLGLFRTKRTFSPQVPKTGRNEKIKTENNFEQNH